MALPHIFSHIVVWGAAPDYQLKTLFVSINNMLRTILGVNRINGRPTISNDDLYKQLGLLKLSSIHKYELFKFLKLMLDGKLPEFWNILMAEYITPHTYNTRQIRLRHPALVCEVERRALPHQLIVLYEDIPSNLLEENYSTAVKHYKKLLLDCQ